jgi:hypothetical protein
MHCLFAVYSIVNLKHNNKKAGIHGASIQYFQLLQSVPPRTREL